MDIERLRAGEGFSLADHDPTDRLGLSPDEARRHLAELAEDLADLQYRLEAEEERAILLVLQGLATAGKDEVLRQALRGLNPMGYHVEHFTDPEGIALSHDYLWRFHRTLPAFGRIGVFNRSHHEAVISDRVWENVPEERWRRRYRHLREFERMLHDEGVRVVKVFLHVSRDEQARRLRGRLEEPDEQWEFDVDDLEEREHWDEFMAAYEDAFAETSTDHAPWYVVPADHEDVRNVAVLEVLREHLVRMDPQIPRPDFDPDEIEID